MRHLLRLILMFLPWRIRRPLLIRLFGYQIDRTARIGLAWVYPSKLVMESETSIGHMTFCVHLDLVHLKPHATIGRGNWITGFPTRTDAVHFRNEPEREAKLTLKEHSAITHRHLVDCTAQVTIGPFATVAGFGTQILTHTIDLEANHQSSRAITIGAYCFVGTACVILGGAHLPDYSVLGAKSLLNRAQERTFGLYGGVPARWIKQLPDSYGYFHRQSGRVD